MVDAAVVGYMDPGTGSIVLQVVAAAFLTAGIVMRRYLFKPFAFLLRLVRGRTPVDEPASKGEIG